MREKLTQRLEKVIRLARAIARDAECEYLGTEHVLLAIVKEGTSRAAAVMVKRGINEAALTAKIAARVRKSMDDTWVFGQLPGSPHLKAAIAAAISIARQFDADRIGAEHLVLAMLQDIESVAGGALSDLGLTYEAMRADLLDHHGDGVGTT